MRPKPFKQFALQHRLETVAVFSIIFLFFFLRLYHLKQLPIFVDEAIYARWAQLGWYDGSLRLVSLEDGKQPLFIWLTTITMNFIYNPVAAIRIVSVMAGLTTVIGLFLLSFELFKNRWISLLSSLLYALYPFAIVINRMGIYESLVGAFLVWFAYFAIILVRKSRLDIALILGLVLGGSLLTKSSGFINIYLSPLALLLLPKGKINKKHLLKLALLGLVTIGMGFLCYSSLLLSNKFYMISEKDALFTYHIRELLPYHAFEKWDNNIINFLNWTVSYFTLPLFCFVAISFFKRERYKEKLLLLLWFLIPFLSLALFSRMPNPRYLFPLTLTLLPLAAFGLHNLYSLKKRWVFWGALCLTVGFLSFYNYKILTDFANSPIPKEDIEQYSEGFSSGQGMREVVTFLQTEAQKQPIIIATEGTYGSLPTTVIQIYFIHNTQTELYAFNILPKRLDKQLYQKAKEKSVYLIFNQTQSVRDWPLELITKYKKGSSNLYLSLYKLKACNILCSP